MAQFLEMLGVHDITVLADSSLSSLELPVWWLKSVFFFFFCPLVFNCNTCTTVEEWLGKKRFYVSNYSHFFQRIFPPMEKILLCIMEKHGDA